MIENKDDKNVTASPIKILLAVISGVAIIFPFLFVSVTALITPAQYHQTFLGELYDKYTLLEKTDQPKIVVIGGSGIAFALDSLLVEEYTGMKTINFGLYATLGTSIMLDLSKVNINRGDIIIIAPETDKQTYSLYFNGEAAWQALDGNYEMLRNINTDNYSSLAGNLLGFFQSKINFFLGGNAPAPSGIYNKSSFNEKGDIIYPREYNIMALGYDPNKLIDLSPEIIDNEFINYINSYTKYAQKKGASVYFSFPPINKSSLVTGTDEESIYEFFLAMADSLDCPIISNINDYIIDKEYFYDTNFHLNDSGKILWTAQLISDLNNAMGNTTPTEIKIPGKPQIPYSVISDKINPDINENYFIYNEKEGILFITDLTEKGLTQIELVIPYTCNGVPVQGIDRGAFSKSSVLEKVIIPEDTNLTILINGALIANECLTQVEIKCHPDKIQIGNNLMNGVSQNLMIYTPTATLFAEYVTHYNWGALAQWFDIKS